MERMLFVAAKKKREDNCFPLRKKNIYIEKLGMLLVGRLVWWCMMIIIIIVIKIIQ